MRIETLQEERRVQQRKEGPNPPHTHTQRTKTCETCDPTNLEMSYIFNNTPQRKAPWQQRGRESTLTGYHSCHRPRIPGRHVLIERRCLIKHCKKREGCNKEKRKTKPTTQTTKTRSRFKPQPKTRTTRVRLVTRRTSSCRINSTTHHNGRCRGQQRGREYTYCIA